MEENLSMMPLQAIDSARLLSNCNEFTAHYGLILQSNQIANLVERRFKSLKAMGRVEFGEGILQKLVYTFCDSPFINQSNYEETLCELQDIFYYFKNESLDVIADDELLEHMKTTFNGKAQGSTEYLAGTDLEALCRILRGGDCEEEDDESELD